MDIVNPDFGLIFWTTSVFVLLLILLRIFAWKPILKAVNNRNQSIEDSLEKAKEAQKELENIQETQKEMIDNARADRDKILNEAKEIREEMLNKAKDETKETVAKMKSDAAKEIETQKQAALDQIKDQMADLSISIAEKILKNELQDKEKQNKLVKQLIDDVKLN